MCPASYRISKQNAEVHLSSMITYRIFDCLVQPVPCGVSLAGMTAILHTVEGFNYKSA